MTEISKNLPHLHFCADRGMLDEIKKYLENRTADINDKDPRVHFRLLSIR